MTVSIVCKEQTDIVFNLILQPNSEECILTL